MDVLVLGGTGGLGACVVDELTRRRFGVRMLARRPRDDSRVVVGDPRDPAVVTRAAAGAGAIVDCAGASVAMGLGHGWRGYRAVDTPIGLAAVQAARATGARLIYIGANHVPALARCTYVDAHERVAAAMHEIDGVVVRATGFFSAFTALLPLARRGILVDVGDGRARTNPIDEHELASIVVDTVTREGPRELAVGGPQVLTRREIFETIAGSVGRRVRIVRLPVWLGALGSALLRPLHPRIAQFAQFATGLATHDGIAPAAGTTTLGSYLARVAAAA